MSTASPYIEALTEIARALFQTPAGEAIAWDVDLLPGQVERELTRLRVENRKLAPRLALEDSDGS